MTSTDAPTAGAAGADKLAAATAGAALLAAGTPALAIIDVAGAALVATTLAATEALEGVALLEDFVLAQPATNNTAAARETVALIAADLVRIAFCIPGLRTRGLVVTLVSGDAAVSHDGSGRRPVQCSRMSIRRPACGYADVGRHEVWTCVTAEVSCRIADTRRGRKGGEAWELILDPLNATLAV